MIAIPGSGDATLAALHQLLSQVRGSADERSARLGRLVEESLLPRLEVAERVQHSMRRLVELGPVSEIIDAGAAEAAVAVQLERVLLSRVEDGCLVPEAVHLDGDPQGAVALLERLHDVPFRLDYPLVEGEVMRRRRPMHVPRASDHAVERRRPFAAALGWQEYVTAPIVVDSRVVGFLHGDRPRMPPPLGTIDAEGLDAFARCLALVFERAILRRRLRIQREEIRRIASWADAIAGELSDRAIVLAPDGGPGQGDGAVQAASASDAALRDLLTRRELDVLKLMVRGETNAQIARDLVVSVGTVKFHVKNILRKMHASNRSEAISRYLRLTLGHGNGS